MQKKNAFRCGNIIVQEAILNHKRPGDAYDVIAQTFYAGTLTKHGSLIIYGTGAERGTWGQFANIKSTF
jgi:hypothetical protein